MPPPPSHHKKTYFDIVIVGEDSCIYDGCHLETDPIPPSWELAGEYRKLIAYLLLSQLVFKALVPFSEMAKVNTLC